MRQGQLPALLHPDRRAGQRDGAPLLLAQLRPAPLPQLQWWELGAMRRPRVARAASGGRPRALTPARQIQAPELPDRGAHARQQQVLDVADGGRPPPPPPRRPSPSLPLSPPAHTPPPPPHPP